MLRKHDTVWKMAMPRIANFAVLCHSPMAAHASAVHHSAKRLSERVLRKGVSKQTWVFFLPCAEPMDNINTKTGYTQNCTSGSGRRFCYKSKIPPAPAQLCCQHRYLQPPAGSCMVFPQAPEELHPRRPQLRSEKTVAQYWWWWKERWFCLCYQD